MPGVGAPILVLTIGYQSGMDWPWRQQKTSPLPEEPGTGQAIRLFRASNQLQFFAKEGVDAQLGDID